MVPPNDFKSQTTDLDSPHFPSQPELFFQRFCYMGKIYGININITEHTTHLDHTFFFNLATQSIWSKPTNLSRLDQAKSTPHQVYLFHSIQWFYSTQPTQHLCEINAPSRLGKNLSQPLNSTPPILHPNLIKALSRLELVYILYRATFDLNSSKSIFTIPTQNMNKKILSMSLFKCRQL